MRRKPLTLGVLIAIAVVAGQALLIPLFAAPAANLAPRDLPLAVAGPPQVATQLEAQHPGAFEITQVADPAAAWVSNCATVGLAAEATWTSGPDAVTRIAPYTS